LSLVSVTSLRLARDRTARRAAPPVERPGVAWALPGLVFFAVVTAATVAIVLALGVPIAYAVVRGRGWMTSAAFRVFLLGLAIPAQAVIIPLLLVYLFARRYLVMGLMGVGSK
jgi:ABC-type glycerol-3-phosphate transport system permease component